jgi:hypothetical protein
MQRASREPRGTVSSDEAGCGCSSSGKRTYAPSSCDSKKLFLRPFAATTFSRLTIYGRSSASEQQPCGVRSCVRKIWTATSFYHRFDYWTSWLQPLESSVRRVCYNR